MKIKRKDTRPMTMGQFDKLFPHEDACKKYLFSRRWLNGVKCPRCGNEKVYELESKEWHWECGECAEGNAYRFSILVGTIFENTNVPLLTWFKVIYLMLSSKKGMSALQIQRMMGFGSYRTAWSMCHRVRAGLGNVEFRKLIGFVEVDETYVGGKAKNKHGGRGPGGTGGPRGVAGKIPIIGAVSRKGNVVARVLDNTSTATMDAFVHEAVSHKVSLLSTDDHAGYRHIGRDYPHSFVRHSAGEYVVGAVHTQTIEGFWSIVKRGVVGTFHKVSRKYLPLYVNEFQFRYNNRNNPDIFGAAIKAC